MKSASHERTDLYDFTYGRHLRVIKLTETKKQKGSCWGLGVEGKGVIKTNKKKPHISYLFSFNG